MSKLLERLRLALLQGAALASATGLPGCDDGDDEPTVDASTGRSGAGGSDTPVAGSAGGPTKPRTDSGVPLAPYALDRLGCYGDDHDGGFYGRCCVRAVCDEPLAGGFCDTRPDHGLPSGSGTCTCRPFEGFDSDGREDAFAQNITDGVEGPYAPNPADPADPSLEDGQCCYLVASISCTGRPLIVGGVFVVAPVVLRTDWAGLV